MFKEKKRIVWRYGISRDGIPQTLHGSGTVHFFLSITSVSAVKLVVFAKDTIFLRKIMRRKYFSQQKYEKKCSRDDNFFELSRSASRSLLSRPVLRRDGTGLIPRPAELCSGLSLYMVFENSKKIDPEVGVGALIKLEAISSWFYRRSDECWSLFILLLSMNPCWKKTSFSRQSRFYVAWRNIMFTLQASSFSTLVAHFNRHNKKERNSLVHRHSFTDTDDRNEHREYMSIVLSSKVSLMSEWKSCIWSWNTHGNSQLVKW